MARKAEASGGTMRCGRCHACRFLPGVFTRQSNAMLVSPRLAFHSVVAPSTEVLVSCFSVAKVSHDMFHFSISVLALLVMWLLA